MYKLEYDNLKHMPVIVRYLCFNHNAWVVGSAAFFLCGGKQPRDWDIIVPLIEWPRACKSFPVGSTTNNFGGVKIKSEDTEIDVWAEDLGTFIQSQNKLVVAVAPKTQQVCTTNTLG